MANLTENEVHGWGFRLVDNSTGIYPQYADFVIELFNSDYVDNWVRQHNYLTYRCPNAYPVLQFKTQITANNVWKDLHITLRSQRWKSLLSILNCPCEYQTHLTPVLGNDLKGFITSLNAFGTTQASSQRNHITLSAILKLVKEGDFIRCTYAVSAVFTAGKEYEVKELNGKLVVIGDGGQSTAAGQSCFEKVTSLIPRANLSTKDPYPYKGEWRSSNEEKEQVKEYDSWGIGKEYKAPKKEYDTDNPEDTKYLKSNKRICDW